jgi:hypothetical protein
LYVSSLVAIFHVVGKKYQVAFEVVSFTTCELQSSNMPHIEQTACYKIDSMPNFKFLLEIEEEHTFLQSEYKENEHDAASCEQWAHGKDNPPLMTFQLNWMQLKNPPYTSLDNHDGC